MNEFLFFTHALLVVLFSFIALRIGKEALMTSIALQAVMANLFVTKQIALFGLQVTCSDVFIIGSILSLNLLQEYFGKPLAKRATLLTFYALVFFTLMSQIHLFYLPGPADTMQNSFKAILSSAPRIIIASLIVFFLSQKFDIALFSFLKRKLPRLSLAKRSLISSSCSQGVDTVLFSFLGLYGIVASVWNVILLSSLIKIAILVISSPLLHFSKYFLPRQAHEI
jgi:queuosine precursor transporter